MDIKEMLNNSKEYEFLKTNEHLGRNICLLTLGGSLAYGTNLPGKGDIDIRGITLESPKDLIGFGTFEQVVETNTDTVIYGFNKMVKLLLSCNPNTIEILGCKPEHYFILTEAGKMIIDNQKLFLSKRAGLTFGAYAAQQLNRMMNALARDRFSQGEKEEQILRSLNAAMCSFNTRYSSINYGSIKLFTDKTERENFETEIFADINFNRFPVREFNGIMNELSSIVRSYNKCSHRNHKKDDEHLNKHAMHLIRLYLMGIDLLEKEQINTYREKDRELLLEIRQGKFMKSDGTYCDEFFDLMNKLKERFEYATENTSLLEKPNFKEVESLVFEVNKKIISGCS